MPKPAKRMKKLEPIKPRELLYASIPLAVLYLLQAFSALGLTLSGLIGIGLYLAIIFYIVPKLWHRPLTIVSLLMIGGAFALTISICANIAYYALTPIESPLAYVALISLSGLDAPSLLIPASLLLFRVSQQILHAALPMLSSKSKTDTGFDA